MNESRLITAESEWTFPVLERFNEVIGDIAKNQFGLDTYPNQIEIITSEQMMDAYSSVGMPINYTHWSFGKQFVLSEKSYRRGQMGLAYEIVINSNPCIAYCMEENSSMMQALVIAHAAYGHNSFFKGNHLFRAWTSADAIIDYLVFARNYVAECEEKHGSETVELFLDSCHSLMHYGVDRYKHPTKISLSEEKNRQRERESYLQSQINDLWRTIPSKQNQKEIENEKRFPVEPQENILYFIEKNAPLLEPWQREIIRIVRKIAQYFYPQRQTQVMNEGWATFWHWTLVNELYDQGYINDGFMIEFLESHTSVIYQPTYDNPRYSGINPYTLGFSMMRDIRRICEEPTPEDRHWFPDIAGTDWKSTLDFAMRNFKDESFISQYLSPKVIRDLKLFAVRDDESIDHLEVMSIHNEDGYRDIRQSLSDQYNLGSREANIQIWNANTKTDRSLTLQHTKYQGRPINLESAKEVLKHLRILWGFTVRLQSVDSKGRIKLEAEIS